MRRQVRELAQQRGAPAAFAFALVATAATLALGSVHTPVLCVVAIAMLVLFALHYGGSRATFIGRSASIVLVVGVVLTAWTCIQQVPLPFGVLAALAPANADVWERSLAPLKEAGPNWAPLSLDPTATRVQVLRGVVYLLVFAIAIRIAARRRGTRFLEWSLVFSAVIVALAAVVHPVLSVERVFGVYRPDGAEFGTRLAPLLNTNHLSAYLNLGGCIALARGLSPRTRVPRLIPLGFYFLLVAVQISAGSRGGVVAMTIGGMLVVWLTRRADPERTGMRWTWVAGGAALFAVVVYGVLTVRDRALSELSSVDTIKVDLVKRATAAVATFPWLGMGRGAFESVFQAFRNDYEGHLVFTHAENIVVHWAAEWGMPLGLGSLVALAYALRPTTALSRSSVPVGPAAALIAVVAHNLVDFSIEIPGIAVALAICAGCVAGGTGHLPQAASRAWWTRRPRLLVLVAGIATAAAVAGACTGIGRELHDDQVRLRDLAMRDGVDRAIFVAAARTAMLRHPAEPYLPLMGAVRAARTDEESAIPWLGRTLERGTVYGRAQLLLAREVAARSPSHARLAYRLAMEQDYNLIGAAVDEGARLVVEPEDALQLVPAGRHTDIVIQHLAERLRARRPRAADRLDALAAERTPHSRDVARVAAEKARAELDGAPRCAEDRAGCAANALAAAERLRSVAPRECLSHRLAAEVRASTGDVALAFEELNRGLDHIDDPAGCLALLLDLARRTGDDKRVAFALERLAQGGCRDEAECVANLLVAAHAEEQRKRHRRAMAFAKKAHVRAPDHRDALVTLARTASASGAHGEALEAYRKLASREPDEPAWPAAIAAARAALDGDRARALGIGDVLPTRKP